MTQIIIADEQPAVVQGLQCFFKSHPEILIIGTVHKLADLENVLKAKKPDLLIIDLELEGLHSIKTLKKIIQENPKTKLLVYTNASEKLFGVTSLKAGASGFVCKKESLSRLEKSVIDIANGETAFNEFVYKSVYTSSRKNKENQLYRKLSTREKEVLNFFISGKKNNEISDLLGLNEKTISTYKLRLLSKLQVTNLVDLVNKAKTLEIV